MRVWSYIGFLLVHLLINLALLSSQFNGICKRLRVQHSEFSRQLNEIKPSWEINCVRMRTDSKFLGTVFLSILVGHCVQYSCPSSGDYVTHNMNP